mmetsp:Transcript_71626/g.167717  ORF Transcript_71626/g.167717 Transcript_71626/m.167717 type:complete len:102 (-) Transcript_71626:1027-1332(-)
MASRHPAKQFLPNPTVMLQAMAKLLAKATDTATGTRTETVNREKANRMESVAKSPPLRLPVALPVFPQDFLARCQHRSFAAFDAASKAGPADHPLLGTTGE